MGGPAGGVGGPDGGPVGGEGGPAGGVGGPAGGRGMVGVTAFNSGSLTDGDEGAWANRGSSVRDG